MLSLHSLLIYCGVYAIAIAVPGPGIVAIVARALGSGFRTTLPAVAGTVIGDWILMTLSAFGLALVAKAMGSFFLAIKLAGAAYLVYLGYKYWTIKVEENVGAAPDTGSGFLAQLGLTLGNPKAIAFFVALLPTVVDLNHVTAISYAELSAVTFVLIPAITLTYAALASKVRGLLTSVKARRRINRGAGAVMIGAAAAVIAS